MLRYFSSATPSGISYCMFGTGPIFVSREVHVPDLVLFSIWFSLLELLQLLTLQKFQEKRELLNLWPLGFFWESSYNLDHTTQYTFFCMRKFYCMIITSTHLAHVSSISLSFHRESKHRKKKMCFSLFYQVWPHSQWSSLICAQTDFSCCELCCKAPKNPEEIKSEVQGFRSSLDPPLRPWTALAGRDSLAVSTASAGLATLGTSPSLQQKQKLASTEHPQCLGLLSYSSFSSAALPALY